ncbi:hypothetical protein [Streptacidiphilus anmyonensis]|uniref:hypothetical protein n=1 Tax=Streptacidiphilus anmyonensis TaxID=405782 RepID=UPI000B338507|nr:hypothetical protein [Streptacidiphilus anmyonensis]
MVDYDPSGFAIGQAGFVRARRDGGPSHALPKPRRFLKADLEKELLQEVEQRSEGV